MQKGAIKTGHPRSGRPDVARPVTAGVRLGALLVLALCWTPQAFAGAPYLGVPIQGSAKRGATLSSGCASCHGAKGNSVSPTFPNLAGQNYNYLLKQLEDFRNGAREASPMKAMIKTIPKKSGDQNLKDIAAYFAAQSLDRNAGANASQSKPTRASALAGYRIYEHGDSDEKVPACSACHMASGLGNRPMAIPALAGQHAKYVETELRRFASGKRHNSPQHVMQTIAGRLSAKQIKRVSEYVQALRPKLTLGIGPHTYGKYTKDVQTQPVPGIPPSGLRSGKSPGSAGHGKK